MQLWSPSSAPPSSSLVRWVPEDYQAFQERPLVGLVGKVSRSAWGTVEFEGVRKLEAVLAGCWRLGLQLSCSL